MLVISKKELSSDFSQVSIKHNGLKSEKSGIIVIVFSRIFCRHLFPFEVRHLFTVLPKKSRLGFRNDFVNAMKKKIKGSVFVFYSYCLIPFNECFDTNSTTIT